MIPNIFDKQDHVIIIQTCKCLEGKLELNQKQLQKGKLVFALQTHNFLVITQHNPMTNLFGFGKQPDPNTKNLNDPYSLNGIGEVPRLSQGTTPQTKNPYNYSNSNSTDYQPLLSNNPAGANKNLNQPLIGSGNNYNNNGKPIEQYNTVIEDGTQGNSSSNSNKGMKYFAAVKEAMKMEGKTPLCKMLTYLNMFLAFLILVLIFQAF